MKHFFLFLILISFSGYSQSNRFTGAWSNENCTECHDKYILKVNIAQSYRLMYGTVELINVDEKLSTGIMEISGWVYALGETASIKLKAPNGISASVTLSLTDDGKMEFNKRGGTNLLPKQIILNKMYE